MDGVAPPHRGNVTHALEGAAIQVTLMPDLASCQIAWRS